MAGGRSAKLAERGCDPLPVNVHDVPHAVMVVGL
jgi:hypothetical protein